MTWSTEQQMDFRGGGRGEVFWQGSGPWIAFLLAKGGASLTQQTDRPSA